MNILITGGAGFVGSYLAVKFARNGDRVYALDNLQRRGAEFNLGKLAENGVEFIHGDVRNPEDLDITFDVDAVIECSAEPSVLAGFGDNPLKILNTNLIGAMNCLELARRRSALFVFLSTSRVYPVKMLNRINYSAGETRLVLSDDQPISGISPEGVSEDFPIDGARTMYGTTKLSAELIIQEYIENYGMKAIINRCGVIAGPGQMGKIDQGVITFWIANHIYGKELSYIGFGGEGKQVRDVLHVEDLFNLLNMQIENIDKVSGKIFNAGGGTKVSTSLLELTGLCREITGGKVKLNSIVENRKGDIPVYISDISKIRNSIGWEPQITMGKIVEDIAVWIKDNKSELESILTTK